VNHQNFERILHLLVNPVGIPISASFFKPLFYSQLLKGVLEDLSYFFARKMALKVQSFYFLNIENNSWVTWQLFFLGKPLLFLGVF
jgi:hypothetical protein